MQWKTIGRFFGAVPGFGGLVLVVLVVPVAGVGCRSATPSSAAAGKRLDGLTLRVACPSETSAGLVTRFSRAWAAQNGARVDVVPYSAVTGPAAGDAWVIEAAELPHWASAGRLCPLPDSTKALGPANSYDWGDVLPFYRSLLLQYAGQTYAVPLHGEPLLCLYRADLLGDPGEQQAFKDKYGRTLGPPATWDEFVEVAEFFAGRRNDGAGMAPLPAEPEALAREFYAMAAPHVVLTVGEGAQKTPRPEELLTFQFDYSTGLPNINAPGFVRALELMQKLRKCRAPGRAADPAVVFRDGNAVLCLARPAALARCSDSPVRDKFGVCRLPGSRRIFRGKQEEVLDTRVNYAPYLDGGWLGVVPANGQHTDAAFELLMELSGPATSREIVSDPVWGGGPTRRSHFSRAEDWYAFGLGREATEALRETVRRSVDPLPINPALRLRVPDQGELQTILVEEIQPALQSGSDPQQALDIAAQRWRERDAKRGELRREEYRRSLGR
jgi:multiple sugar transport system substrate-binding protein